MKIGKLELTQEKLLITVALAVLVVIVGAYVIFYAPLMGKLKTKYMECKAIENEALECRNIIESAGKVYGKRVLMTESEVYQTIDELTRHGSKTEGVDFISIKPKKVEKTKRQEYKILPIEMKVESTYEKLGIFLGSLDDMERSLVKVKSFDIDRDEKNPDKFITDVEIEVYISGRENEG